MEQLNDDCLITIFKLVGLADQLALAQASRRFRSVLQDYIWAYEHRHVYLDFNAIATYLEQFQAYVTYVLPCAEVVRFKSIPEELFRVLIGHCFPNVQELTFTTASRFIDEQFMITLSGIFPNLKTLRPQAHIEGECLAHFEKVENLILHHCTGVELRHFITVIRILKLKSLELDIFPKRVRLLGENLRHLHGLERLAVNNHEVAWLLVPNAVRVFTHLREIIVSDDMKYEKMKRLFKFLSALRGGNVSILEFRFCKYLRQILNAPCFSFYAQLEKMYFFNLDGFTDLKIYQHISIRFPALREIYFYECIFETVADVLKLFESDLEFVNIEESTTLFTKIQIPVRRIMANRHRPITLNFYRNFYRKVVCEEISVFPIFYNRFLVESPVILECEETELFKVTALKGTFNTNGTVRIVLQ